MAHEVCIVCLNYRQSSDCPMSMRFIIAALFFLL